MSKKKYWLRGGIVGIVIGIVISFPGFYQYMSSSNALCHVIACPPAQHDIYFFISNIKDTFQGKDTWGIGFGPIDLLFTLLYPGGILAILIGVFLGWIYGKIKNRKLKI